MRISDWSSDVCSSDLAAVASCADLGSDYKRRMPAIRLFGLPTDINSSFERGAAAGPAAIREALWSDRGNMASEIGDRKSVVEGKSVSVSVDPGGSRKLKKKKQRQ